MQIWIVNSAMIPPVKPGGTRHHTMAKRMSERHDVTLITSNAHHSTLRDLFEVEGTSDLRVIEGVRYLIVRTFMRPVKSSQKMRLLGWFSFAGRMMRSVRTLPRPDVIVGSSPNLIQALAAERLARRYRVPFVLEVRDLWPETLIRLGGYSPYHPFVLVLSAIERYLYRRASSIVTLMEESKVLIASRGGKHIVAVPNGAEFELADAPVEEPPIVLDKEAFNVVYAGSLGLSNAIDSILDAAKMLLEQGMTEVRFSFVGDGGHKAQLVERCTREGLVNVRFFDPVPKKHVYALLRQADALIVNALNAALYEHGVSFNKIFDYMAVGKPTVFAVASGIMELSGGGITCPPDDAVSITAAILRLKAMSASERAEMGAKARAYVETHHDVAKLARTFESTIVTSAKAIRT